MMDSRLEQRSSARSCGSSGIISSTPLLLVIISCLTITAPTVAGAVVRQDYCTTPENQQSTLLTAANDRERRIVVPWSDTARGAPIRRALQGESGILIHPDYQGHPVLAAYPPINRLRSTLIIEKPLREIHSPFIRFALFGGAIALVAISAGVLASFGLAHILARRRRERDARYRVIFENSATSYFIFENAAFTQANQRCGELLGVTAEKLVGHQMSDFSPSEQPDGRESTIELTRYFTRANAGTEVHFLWRLIRRDGQPIDCEVTLHPLVINRRRVVIGSLKDLTETLNQKRRLVIQECALQSTQSGIAIADATQPDAPLVWANNAFLAMTGYSSDEVIGRNCRFLQGSDRDQPGIGEISRALRAKKSVAVTLRNYRKDGSRFINSVRIDPVRNESGVVTHFVGVLEDITRYVEQEQRLQLFQRVADQSPAWIIITDVKGNIQYVNKQACETSGYSRDELMGQNSRILGSGEVASATYAAMWNRLTRGRQWLGEWVNRRKNGERYTESVHAFPIRDGSGKITHLVAQKVDVTEQRKSEAEKTELANQLLHLQRIETIGTLAGGIAHDFNNLVGAIRGWTELAQRHAKGNAQILSDLGHVLVAADRSRDLVEQILTFSRQTDVQTATFDLVSLVSEMVKLLKSTIPKHIDVATEIEISEAKVIADPAQIQQVVLNLCTNAAYAMKDQDAGQLKVRLQLRKNRSSPIPGNCNEQNLVQLDVEDNGTGMDAETRARIFEPFFTTKPINEGTGMGLAISFGIVRSVGGQIQVQSQPGEGTRFRVILPHAPQVKREAEPVPHRPLPGSERILLVDDDPEMAKMAHCHLSELGYQVTAMQETGEAMKIIKRNPSAFDILVTDQIMPTHSGMDLIREYRRHSAGFPAIVMTGHQDSVDLKKIADLGNVELITKPYSLADLTRMIRRRVEYELPSFRKFADLTSDPAP